MLYLFIVISSIFSVAASISLKVAASNAKDNGSIDFFSFEVGLYYFFAIIFYGGGFLFYALSLKKIDLSVAYPLMVGITMLGIFSYGVFWSNEVITMYRLLGATFVMLGIFLIVR